MEKNLRLLYLSIASSILLPYGVLTADTPIFTTNQYWFFPLLTYLHDFGNWLNLGRIIIIFSPPIPFIHSVLGLLWGGSALYVSYSLYRCSVGQIDTKSVWTLTLCLLILQIIVTIIVGFFVWGSWLGSVIPLPFHFLIVLFLLWFQVHRVILEDTKVTNT